jgi:hypothetical protein
VEWRSLCCEPDNAEHGPIPLARKSRLPDDRNYEAIYGAYLSVQRMVSKDGMKLILYPNVPKALLFDLKNDPLEMTDLSGDPERSATMKSLFATFLALQKETGDKLDAKSTFPQLCP